MIIGVLQARFSSSRLSGKVLKLILNKPMLALQIERISMAKSLDKLIIATSVLPDDDAIAAMSEAIGVACFRGSLNDVLDRCYQAVAPSSPQHVVRLTGDCPLCDPLLIDAIVNFHVLGAYDYSSNTLAPTYPDGLDVEVCRFTALQVAHREAILPSHREHVTQFIHQQPERFKLGDYRDVVDKSHLRWTVDEALDFELVKQVYQSLYPTNPEFTTKEILAWLDSNPQWLNSNTHLQRNEGLAKSLAQDRDFELSQSKDFV
jgi:spore coat polysaccharide biosynthesis protein SpsF